MTKEALLARKHQLEGEIQDQRNIQASAKDQIARLDAQFTRARDLENSLGGALQDVNHWLQQLELANRAKEPTKQ